MYATFLKAQERSPSLVLAHAGIGDAGAHEIARHLADSQCLVHLDLSGCGIGPTGAGHLAKALKINRTLESLVLQHNRIGEGGEEGLAELCRALRGRTALKHLDLRHNGLCGIMAGSVIGELLRHNESLTHLELSWNALEPGGGHSIWTALQMNTTLFDCQLTSCQIAEETLVGIAELLYRNRRAKGANMQAGPYKALPIPDTLRRGRGTDTGHPCTGDSAAARAVAVTPERTAELLERLAAWRIAKRDQGQLAETARVQELMGHLDQGQRELQEARRATEEVKEHTRLLAEGFQARELRYRGERSAAQDKLVDYENEMLSLRAVHRRLADQLGLQKDRGEQVKLDFARLQGFLEAEDRRLRTDLANVGRERKELEEHLRGWQAKLALVEEEHATLRSKMDRARAHTLHSEDTQKAAPATEVKQDLQKSSPVAEVCQNASKATFVTEANQDTQKTMSVPEVDVATQKAAPVTNYSQHMQKATPVVDGNREVESRRLAGDLMEAVETSIKRWGEPAPAAPLVS
mmetsp:Transcript_98371/g.267032  ORF Transcript_98371/g.267032 Transcript_98371/m.267032 type:complete len:522 (-) Transcript_98371:69-1634(-)